MKTPLIQLTLATLLLGNSAFGVGTTVVAAADAAQPAEIRQALQSQEKKRPHIAHFNLGKKGLAIQGYDPVAYFKEGGGKPLKGKETLTFTHLQVTYRFASQKNLDLFKKDPTKFEPLYGGWCAFAMADNDKTDINPKSFLIQDGKLLLFYDGFWGDTRKQWIKDPKGFSPKAKAGWTKFTSKKK
jgi:hypothetical protein